MGRSNVFSLEQIYRKQVTQTWSKIPEVFRYVNSLASSSPAGTDFGYFMGGTAECCPYLAPFSTVDRLDFSNDTDNMVTKASLTETKTCRGYSSFTHGYAAGGWNPAAPGQVTTIDRIDYASDTTAQTAKGPLEIAVASNAVGLHNTEYGYTLGGGTPSYVSYNQRLDFSSDTSTTSPKGNLTTAAGWGAGSGNQSYGYYSGGLTPSYISTVQRLDYSSDTTTMAPKGPLSRVVKEHDAAGNADYGYHAGGWDPGTPYATMNDRIDYSNDTATALLRGLLGYPGRHGPSATGNTSYGYWTGGYGNTTNSYRLDYSSDTTQMSVKGKRTTFSQNSAGVSSRANAMPLISSTDIVPATRIEAGMTPVTNFGYFAGGSYPVVSTVDRVDYANDTATAAVKGPLDRVLSAHQSTSNSTHGYFGGSSSPSNAGTQVSRIEFSNDTATAVAKGPLSAARKYFGATGNTSFGYYAGSSPSSAVISTIDRIDYANDTATASPKGTLENSRSTMAASGTSDFGYWSGGYPYYTKASRIAYANDTATAVAKATYPSTVTPYGFSNGAGTGNSTHGYAAGGNGYNSYVWRIDYTNDTANGVQKGPLSQGRLRFSAASPLENGLPSKLPGPVDKGADGYTTTPSGPAMGYVLGGAFPYSFSTVDRVDYSNDTATASVKGPLSAGTSYHAAVSSKDYGYSMGGKTPSNSHSTKVDRVDYGNDTATATPKGALNIGAYRCYAGVGNKDYGYHPGGDSTQGTPFSTHIQRIEYASDTSTATPKGNLAAARYLHSGTGNLSYGYAAIGGSSPFQNNSVVQRIEYANDTATAVIKGNLNQGSRKNTATGNADYGYVGGGTNPDLSQITRIDYSNDTATSVAKGPLTMTRDSLSSFSAPGHGYFAGGRYPVVSSTDRMDYSSDTTTAVAKGNLSGNRGYFSGVSSRDIGGSLSGTPTFIPRVRWVDGAAEGSPIAQGPAHGYIAGGAYPDVSSNVSDVHRIDFDNDTAAAAPKGNLASATKRNDAVMNSTHGYVTGDMGPAPSRVHRIDYANDTATASIKGPLSANTSYMMDVTNINFGYVIGGGGPSGQKSKIDRIDFSNDTATASNIASLPANKWSGTGIGNKNFGYICGGKTPSIISNIDRLDYSSDTTAVAPKGPLSATRRYNTATSNNDFGYVGGGAGNNSDSSVDRVDFSNDTATASTKGPLTTTGNYRTATGNSNFGYFAGGQGPSMNLRSTIDRIDYSNDTATASTKGALPVAKNKAAGISARESGLPIPQPTIAAPVQPPFPFPVQLYNPATSKQHGYWACGVNRDPMPSTIAFSSVDRLDFSNDTTAASPKGNASFATAALQSVANASYGYITGGYTDHPPAGRSSSINRLDFANDTAALTVTGITPSDTLNGTGIYLGWGVGNASYGYWGGNYPGSSRIFRLDYSNDTSAPLISGKSISFSYGSAAGNQDYGWIGGVGHPLPSGGSRVERLDYSNDTNNTVTRGPLSSVRYDGAASSNASYGWWGAGKNGSPAYSYVDRIDFGNDTATATPKGNLQYATSQNDGTGDTNYGYFGGGGPAFSARSYIQRIDYANDTATSSPKGPLSVP